MRRRILTCALASLVVACLALSQAWAATRETGEDYWIDLLDATTKAHSGTINWLGSNWAVWAGAYKVKISDYTGMQDVEPETDTPTSYRETWVVCIDRVILTDPDWYRRCVGGVPSSNIPALTPEKWAKKVWLVNTFGYGAVWNGTKDTAAGLQLAIWEVLTDDPDPDTGKYSLSSGGFQVISVDQKAIDYANELLASVPDASQVPDTWLKNDVYYVNSQNLNEVPIPEPFTLVLAGLGIGTVAGLRRLAMR